MRTIAAIAGALLGLIFLYAALAFFVPALAPEMPPPAEGSPMASLMAAMYPTNYLAFVKVLELVGAVLIAIPKTRRAGLLVLGPIVLNILVINLLLSGKGVAALADPMLAAVVVLTAILIVAERRAFIAFLRGG